MPIDWKAYNAEGIWDELVAPNGRARAGAGGLFRVLGRLSDDRLAARQAAADLAIRTMGITFSVYHDQTKGAIDREWPFDIVPRLIRKREWDEVSRGLVQRVRALNLFIDDVYHGQNALKDGVVPRDYILRSASSGPSASVSIPPTASGATSAAPTSSGTITASSTC